MRAGSMPVRHLLSRLQPVLGAAVRAASAPLGDHVDEHARVVAPQRHLRVRAVHHAGALQLLGTDFDDGLVVVAAHTAVSHSAYLALRPLTMSKNAFWIFVVIGPRAPSPSVTRSYSRIGVTSAAVPVKNASSEM